jgi:dolichyl-phosphate-mannose--protein O-mannosyl transferase
LPFAGQGKGYLPEDMKAQLIPLGTSGIWGTRLLKPGLFSRTLILSWIMHSGNMHIVGFHGAQSRPFNWPILTGMDVGFWGGFSEEIKCHGNVFSYYFALIGVILLLFPYKSPHYLIALRFSFGWAVCYFPFYLIPRTLYLYHYLVPLMIGCMAAGASLDIYFPRRWKGTIAVFICALALFGFWLWMPFVYGKYMHDRKIMDWIPNWDHGDAAYKRESELDRLKPKDQ